MPKYYTKSGKRIYKPASYASTGAPMYKSRSCRDNNNINSTKTIYKANLSYGKKYIGSTGNFSKRCRKHFSGQGAKVTRKFKPKSI